MERTLASSADAEIILKLYELRTEAVMREARAWMTGAFWPETTEEFFAVAANPQEPHNAWYRQVITYWEMAAALVLHGAVSADLFVDCNGEGFFLLAKFNHLLEAIRERTPGFMAKTSELISRFSSAAARYETALKGVESRRSALPPGQMAGR
ncbi:MAG TPA: hypothetical protein VFU68_05495 [Terracidiphilus sp.]|nr:hypothetical protein [Terracidiphilus sp.]